MEHAIVIEQADMLQTTSDIMNKLLQVIYKLDGVTRTLTAASQNIECAAMEEAVAQRKELIRSAQDLRDRLQTTIKTPKEKELLGKCFAPIIAQLFQADAELIAMVRSKKHEVAEKLFMYHDQKRAAHYYR